MPPLMHRPNRITLAILSFGTLVPLTHAGEQSSCSSSPAACSCSSPTVPSLLPQTTPPVAKPKGEKDVKSGGDFDINSNDFKYDANTRIATFTGNVVVRRGDRQIKADEVQIDSSKNVKGQGSVDYTDPIVHIEGAGGDYSPN